ncbi:MAG: copper transporter [Acidimicrobiia bacterium]
MINLRYHIVSLVAVFLALALGIVMGSTVIDKAIVDELRDRVESVGNRASNTDRVNSELRTRLETMEGFASEARDQLVLGRLRGVPVLVVAVQGVDREPVEDVRDALATAQAVPAGTLLFTNKLRLDNEGDARALATAVGANPGAGSDAIRRQALTRVAAVLDGTASDGSLLPALAAAGFIGYEPPSSATTTTTLGLSSFPVPNLRMVLVSGAGAEVGDDRVGLPFAQALLAQTPATAASGLAVARFVAAESGRDTPGGRAVFVGQLRSDATVGPRLSTVDNLESPIGQAAAVLALAEVDDGRTGHYGRGPGAQRLLPSLEP